MRRRKGKTRQDGEEGFSDCAVVPAACCHCLSDLQDTDKGLVKYLVFVVSD